MNHHRDWCETAIESHRNCIKEAKHLWRGSEQVGTGQGFLFCKGLVQLRREAARVLYVF